MDIPDMRSFSPPPLPAYLYRSLEELYPIFHSDTNNFEIEGENIWKNISFRFINA